MLIIDMNKVLISISQIISNKTKGFKVPVAGAQSLISGFLLWGPIYQFLLIVLHKYEVAIRQAVKIDKVDEPRNIISEPATSDAIYTSNTELRGITLHLVSFFLPSPSKF
ncbi:hypothetical protein Avbf_02237 [Armadillidium vulgare]|nr:hypothetical protein Avbf_02237 [Armadillidium vulgare]